MENNSRSPAALILARCRAFREGDFGFIYDSYHPESFFRRQFSNRADYVRHGRTALGRDFQIDECRILREETGAAESRVIFYLDTRFKGTRAQSVELAFLRLEEGGWRYHSSQKLTAEEACKVIEEIDFEDFERVKEKVFF